MFADKKIFTRRWLLPVVLALAMLTALGEAAAISEQELAALSKLGEAQGRPPEDMKRLIEQARRVEALGLPPEPLLDKIKEGLAKGVESSRIEQRLSVMAGNLEKADTLLKETGGGGQTTPGGRARALDILAEALGRGVTPDEVLAIHRAIGEGNREVRAEALAYGAKGMALMKEGGHPADESQALIAAVTRRGADSTSLLDLARELKERGKEFRENPARFRELRSAVEQGERLEKILGDLRTRSDSPRLEQLERGRQDLPRPERPERPPRFDRPDRPQRPHR